MICIDDLLAVAAQYSLDAGVESEKTVSHRVFGDNKRLAALRMGREITVGRFNLAMRWFALNWPEGHLVPQVLQGYFPTDPTSTGSTVEAAA